MLLKTCMNTPKVAKITTAIKKTEGRCKHAKQKSGLEINDSNMKANIKAKLSVQWKGWVCLKTLVLIEYRSMGIWEVNCYVTIRLGTYSQSCGDNGPRIKMFAIPIVNFAMI